MTKSLLFRPAELDDLEALVDLEQRCFDTDRISRRSFRHLLTRGHTVCLVAESRRHLAGYGLLLLSRGTSAARLYSLAVDPGCRIIASSVREPLGRVTSSLTKEKSVPR